MQANSSSAADDTAEEEATPPLEAKTLQPGEATSMEALQKPERKLKETRTFNPRKMRPKRWAAPTWSSYCCDGSSGGCSACLASSGP